MNWKYFIKPTLKKFGLSVIVALIVALVVILSIQRTLPSIGLLTITISYIINTLWYSLLYYPSVCAGYYLFKKDKKLIKNKEDEILLWVILILFNPISLGVMGLFLYSLFM